MTRLQNISGRQLSPLKRLFATFSGHDPAPASAKATAIDGIFPVERLSPADFPKRFTPPQKKPDPVDKARCRPGFGQIRTLPSIRAANVTGFALPDSSKATKTGTLSASGCTRPVHHAFFVPPVHQTGARRFSGRATSFRFRQNALLTDFRRFPFDDSHRPADVTDNNILFLTVRPRQKIKTSLMIGVVIAADPVDPESVHFRRRRTGRCDGHQQHDLCRQCR